jgi:hypothetical protein
VNGADQALEQFLERALPPMDDRVRPLLIDAAESLRAQLRLLGVDLADRRTARDVFVFASFLSHQWHRSGDRGPVGVAALVNAALIGVWEAQTFAAIAADLDEKGS